MPWDIDKIEVELDALEQLMPLLLKKFPDEADFWVAFAAERRSVESGAGAGHAEFVRSRIHRILGSWGLVPPNDDDDAGR